MGVLMWEACSQGEIPYGLRTSDDDIRHRKLNNEKLRRPKGCHNQIWTVIEDCWYNEPTYRFSFEQLKIQFLKINPK